MSKQTEKQRNKLESNIDWGSAEVKKMLALKGFTKAGYIKELKRKNGRKLPGLRRKGGSDGK